VGGNHLPGAAGIVALDGVKQEDLLDKAKAVGEYLIQELNKFERVLEVRLRRVMIGIDHAEVAGSVKNDLLVKNRIFTDEAKPNVIRILPALNITKEIADRFLTALDERLKG